MAGFFILLMSIAILALIIYLWYYIANEFVAIAEMKGHYEKKHFWICFLLGMVGYCMVIALPDRKGAVQSASTATHQLPKL